MRNMLTVREYTETMIRAKGFQRKAVVVALFGGQEALARVLGVTRYAINHVIFCRRDSDRVEEYVLARIRECRPELEKDWERPWAKPKTGRTRRQILKVAAILAGLGLLGK